VLVCCGDVAGVAVADVVLGVCEIAGVYDDGVVVVGVHTCYCDVVSVVCVIGVASVVVVDVYACGCNIIVVVYGVVGSCIDMGV